MKKKYFLLITVILMTLGFAAIATNIVLNGSVSVASNIDDLDVYFSKILINGVEDNSAFVDDTHLSFETNLKSVGDEYTLEYDVTNGSKEYDVIPSITIGTYDSTYLSVTNTFDTSVLSSKETRRGKLVIKLIKIYDSTTSMKDTLDISIKVDVAEKTSLETKDAASKIEKGINLYNMMKTNASKEKIDFAVNSDVSGTDGIYTTTSTESGKEVYYYRGSYEKINNNLIFNNMCWKILRTTETGGVKIIYNGTPTDGKCETQTGESVHAGRSLYTDENDDNAYVGYMYGTAGSSTYEETHANINDSQLKIFVENWYATNFTAINITSKIEDTVYCNDRSTKAYDATTIGDSYYSSYGSLGYGTNATFYGAAHRSSYFSSTPNPSLVCSQNNDKFTVSSSIGNGKLTYPVGIITSDEVILAGFNTYAANNGNYRVSKNYLYINCSFWTMTPIVKFSDVGSSDVGYISQYGDIDNATTKYSYLGTRPVVSLKSGTTAKSTGDGSTTNPYVVE